MKKRALLILINIMVFLCVACGEAKKESKSKVVTADATTTPKAVTVTPTNTPVPSPTKAAEPTLPLKPVVDSKALLINKEEFATAGTRKPNDKSKYYEEYKLSRRNPIEITNVEEKNERAVAFLEKYPCHTYFLNCEYGDEIVNNYVQMSGLKDKECEERINQRIMSVYNALTVEGFYPPYRGVYSALKQHPDGLPIVNCEIYYNAQDILSILFTYTYLTGSQEAMADRNEGYGDDPEYVEYIPCEEMIKYEMPLNFNLETGEELSLSDLFEEGFDYITPINNWIFSTVFESNHVIMDGYIANPESEYDAKSVFAGINPNQKFIVCEDEIILCFGYETPDMCFDEYSSWCQYNFTGRRVEISNHIKQGINGEICTNVSHFNDIYLTKEYDYDVECINSIIYTGEHGDGLLRVKNHSWANKDGKTIGAAITYPKEMKGLTEDSFFKYIENRICKEFGSKYGKYDVHVMHEFEYIGGYRSMEVAFFPMDEQAYESNTESFLYKDNVICTFDEFIIDKNKYRESFIKDIYKNLCDHGDTNDIEYEEIGKIYDCMRPYFDGVSMTYSNNIIPTFSISEDELISIIESKLGSDYSYKCELVMGRMGINTESISNTQMGGDVEIGRIL